MVCRLTGLLGSQLDARSPSLTLPGSPLPVGTLLLPATQFPAAAAAGHCSRGGGGDMGRAARAAGRRRGGRRLPHVHPCPGAHPALSQGAARTPHAPGASSKLPCALPRAPAPPLRLPARPCPPAAAQRSGQPGGGVAGCRGGPPGRRPMAPPAKAAKAKKAKAAPEQVRGRPAAIRGGLRSACAAARPRRPPRVCRRRSPHAHSPTLAPVSTPGGEHVAGARRQRRP